MAALDVLEPCQGTVLPAEIVSILPNGVPAESHGTSRGEMILFALYSLPAGSDCAVAVKIVGLAIDGL